jgi:3-dehydroquinate synthase
MKKIRVHLGKRSYDIIIGGKVIAALGGILKKMRLGDTAVVISNPKIKKLFSAKLKATLDKNRLQYKFLEVPDSETSKSREVAFKAINRIAAWDTQGKIFLIALGGGVVGDLAGFIAAVYKRGIAYVQVPTTLLAQIDSAIGGKVAIDLVQGKNLVGAFYQPRLVFSDVQFLGSLGKREIRSGLAEAVKYGVIRDQALFEFIARKYRGLLALKPQPLESVVERCSRIKAGIVERDEKEEKGLRTILNFGHTIGHAVEAAAGYKSITHGEAVAFGMVCAAEISFRMKLLDAGSFRRLSNLIEDIGLPVRISGIKINKVLDALRHDKKFIAGRNRFVLPVAIGKVVIKENIPPQLIRQVLSARLSAFAENHR